MTAKLLALSAVFGFFSSAALAADLPNAKGPPAFAPPPPVFSWSGFYLGGQIGYQWGTSDPFITGGGVGSQPAYSVYGGVGGGHLGFNWQVSQFVFGVEGDVEGTTYTGETLSAGGNFWNRTRYDIEGSVRGRVGWAWDRILFYGTGGVAFASIENSAPPVLGGPSNAATTGRAGWTAGGGVEFAVDPNWTVRAEYRYTDYGAYDFPLGGTGFFVHEHERDNRIEGGFSYKFDLFPPPAPVVAKY